MENFKSTQITKPTYRTSLANIKLIFEQGYIYIYIK